MPSSSPATPGPLARSGLLLLGTATYALFLITFLAAIGFLTGNFDRTWLGWPPFAAAADRSAIAVACAINLALLLLFAVQHTIMARPGFKRRWTAIVHPAAERPLFVLATNVVLWLLMLQWRPIAGTAWDFGAGPLTTLLWSVCALGWLTVLYSSFLIDHFELFGVAQVLRAFRGSNAKPTPFRERSLYRLVRHPLMLGFLLAFWAVPVMAWDRLLFAAAATLYILLVGLRFEERDLHAAHGAAYADYCRRVPRVFPRLRPASRATSAK